ncbi:MAG: hypothetical protein QM703_00160 [Gemmatales bacterium]
MKPSIARRPVRITLSELLRGKRRQSQQIVAAIHHHIDGQIIAGKDVKVGTNPITQ